MHKDTTNDDIIRGAAAISVIGAAAYFGPAMALAVWLWKTPGTIRRIGVLKMAGIGTLLALIAFCVWFLWFDPYPLYRWDVLYTPIISNAHWLRKLHWVLLGRMIVSGWLGGSGVVLLLAPILLLVRKNEPFIRTRDFSARWRNFKPIIKAFNDPKRVPIGIDAKSGKVISLDETRRASHVLVLGATGSGKTTLMINLILHAVRHGIPCLVIDPKGDDSTLRMIQKIGRQVSPEFDPRLKVFRMTRPQDSCFYNPLKHGSAIQLKDRILEALNWSEQYYQSLAGDFLTVFTACIEKMGGGLTLETLSRVMGNKKLQAEFLFKLKGAVKSGDARGSELYERMEKIIATVKAEDLLGLQAQLSILNSPS